MAATRSCQNRTMAKAIAILGIICSTGQVSAEELVPCMDTSGRLLSLYDKNTGKPLPERIVSFFNDSLVEVVRKGTTTQNAYEVESTVDYMEKSGVEGALALNAYSSMLSTSIDGNTQLKSVGKFSSKTIGSMIRFRRTVLIESVPICDDSMSEYLNYDKLSPEFGPLRGTHVIVGKVQGVLVDIVMKASTTEGTSEQSVRKTLAAEATAVLGFFSGGISGSASTNNDTQADSRTKSLSIESYSNIALPFSFPHKMEEVPGFIKNLMEYLEREPNASDTIMYKLEALSTISECQRGQTVETSLKDVSDELLYAIKQVVVELEHAEGDARAARSELSALNPCLSRRLYSRMRTIMDDNLRNLQMEKSTLRNDLKLFVAGDLQEQFLLEKINQTYNDLTDDEFRVSRRLTESDLAVFEFFKSAVKYDVNCLSRDMNPLMPSTDGISNALYFMFNETDLLRASTSAFARTFLLHCTDESYKCYFLNCDLQFQVCKNVSSISIISVDALAVGVTTETVLMSRLMSAVEYLYRSSVLLEHMVNAVDQKFTLVVNDIYVKMNYNINVPQADFKPGTDLGMTTPGKNNAVELFLGKNLTITY